MIINPNAARARVTHKGRRASKITVPERAHPFVRLVFSELRRQNLTYDELEHLSGVLKCTTKAHRTDNAPGLATIEANLGALGWTLVPVPQHSILPPDAAEALEVLGQHFTTNAEAYGFAIWSAGAFQERARSDVAALRERGRAKLSRNGVPA